MLYTILMSVTSALASTRPRSQPSLDPSILDLYKQPTCRASSVHYHHNSRLHVLADYGKTWPSPIFAAAAGVGWAQRDMKCAGRELWQPLQAADHLHTERLEFTLPQDRRCLLVQRTAGLPASLLPPCLQTEMLWSSDLWAWCALRSANWPPLISSSYISVCGQLLKGETKQVPGHEC